MSETSNEQPSGTLHRYLRAQVSRAQILTAAGAGLAAAMAPRVVGAQTTPTTEATQDIINIADTAEHLAVTVLTAAVNNASTLGLTANGGVLLAVIQAALAEEQYHADFLEANGAKPLTDTFTVPDAKILTDAHTFFATIEAAETIFIGAYMAATREFSQMGNRALAQYAYQIGGVEAEHRVLARAAQFLIGDTSKSPPNNKAFSSDVVYKVADAATILTNLGFIGGTGTKVTYPGRAAALAAAGSVGAGLSDQKPA